jgi:hypothetical protein
MCIIPLNGYKTNQTRLSSHDYCCSLGMYLVTFSSVSQTEPFHAVTKPCRGKILNARYKNKFLRLFSDYPGTHKVFSDETYANGQGGDSWCSNDEALPLDIYLYRAYVTPDCKTPSCSYMYYGSTSLTVRSSNDYCNMDATFAADYFTLFICA